MSTTFADPPRRSWLGRAEDWLDDRGKGAWIAAMVLGFIFFWPVGLALLAYMIWSKRMFSHSCGRGRNGWTGQDGSRDGGRTWGGDWGGDWGQGGRMSRRNGFRSSGNTAFDAYKSDTLDRLEREQGEFEAFLTRLRASKDKAEFDQYMEERARAARDTGPDQGGEGDTNRA
jgi:hypothetical protein